MVVSVQEIILNKSHSLFADSYRNQPIQLHMDQNSLKIELFGLPQGVDMMMKEIVKAQNDLLAHNQQMRNKVIELLPAQPHHILYLTLDTEFLRVCILKSKFVTGAKFNLYFL